MGIIKKVFLIIGILVLAILIWWAVFGNSGVVALTWNAIAKSINDMWKLIAGSGANDIIPEWKSQTDLNKATTTNSFN